MPQFVDNKIITLNSANAILNNGTMLSNVLFLTGCILEEDTSIIDTHRSVANAQIPVSFYVINSSNNKFKFSLKDFVLLSFMYSMYVTAHMTQPWF